MKRLFLLALFVCVASFLGSCAFFDNDSSKSLVKLELDENLHEMVRVYPLHGKVILGTTDQSAKAEERAELTVKISYSFAVGRHEVTCGEFNSLMKPATGLSIECKADNYPVTDITYYDAILFANERSKAENYDTAYTYTKLNLDANGHCMGVDGLVFRPEVEAFRLPTEAEWVFVAKEAWNLNNAWTSENSDYEAHPVCSLAEKEDLLCDMAGNAMEWVNDWLGYFWATTITNYVGAPEGGQLGKRAVKGGSFRNSAVSIHTYSRGDVYTVTSSTKADYVGFRLAFGKIPDATWMGADGEARESRVIPLAGVATLRSLLGSNKIKLAFRNDISGMLSYIDYSAGMLTVRSIADSLDVYHPEISPDGKYIAYCTAFEGVSDSSTIVVRELNVRGTGRVKLSVKNAAIPRWRVLDNGDTVIVYVSSAGNNKDATGFKKESTWQVPFSKGKFGKPEKLFDGAYHDGISEDGTLAVTGARLLRARIAKEGSTVTGNAVDTVWYNGEQACNASLSTDGKKLTLFLDFGGKTGQDFVGKSYETHERILIAGSTGKLIKSVAAPEGYFFDHAEWVKNRSDYAVATLTNAQGAHTKIVLVGIDDGRIVDLVESEELWHPCFWFESLAVDAGDLDLDSAAVYFDGLDGRLLSQKMNAFWAIKDSIEILGLGSSRMSSGFMSMNTTEGVGYNMAAIPCDMNVIHYLATNYGIPHCPRLKVILVSLDLDLWSEDENTNLNTNFANTPGFYYDKNHNFWKENLSRDFVALNSSYLENSDELISLNIGARGWIFLQGNSWNANGFSANIIEGDSTWSDNKENYERNMNKLQDLIKIATEKGILVVGIVFPQSPYYRETGSFGRHGMRRSVADSLLTEMKKWMNGNPFFKLLDENKMGEHSYGDYCAYDYDHLSSDGALMLIKKLNVLMKRWLRDIEKKSGEK